jgi:hypothetical protein
MIAHWKEISEDYNFFGGIRYVIGNPRPSECPEKCHLGPQNCPGSLGTEKTHIEKLPMWKTMF